MKGTYCLLDRFGYGTNTYFFKYTCMQLLVYTVIKKCEGCLNGLTSFRSSFWWRLWCRCSWILWSVHSPASRFYFYPCCQTPRTPLPCYPYKPRDGPYNRKGTVFKQRKVIVAQNFRTKLLTWQNLLYTKQITIDIFISIWWSKVKIVKRIIIFNYLNKK